MSLPITPTVITALRFHVAYAFSQPEDIDTIINTLPRPWFCDEETAFNALKDIVEYAQSFPSEALRIDAINKLLTHKVDALILEEAPSFTLFWGLMRDDLLNILRKHPHLGKRYYDNTR